MFCETVDVGVSSFVMGVVQTEKGVLAPEGDVNLRRKLLTGEHTRVAVASLPEGTRRVGCSRAPTK